MYTKRMHGSAAPCTSAASTRRSARCRRRREREQIRASIHAIVR